MRVDRRELHELINELPDDQVAPTVDELRRRVQEPSANRPWPPVWFGAIDAPDVPADLGRNVDAYLVDGFGRYRS